MSGQGSVGGPACNQLQHVIEEAVLIELNLFRACPGIPKEELRKAREVKDCRQEEQERHLRWERPWPDQQLYNLNMCLGFMISQERRKPGVFDNLIRFDN